MSREPLPAEVYQLHAWLREISPRLWRRLLVRADSTIADLHAALQIAMGWSDAHLHRFVIHGKEYGVAHRGGLTFADDPTRIRLADFGFRARERFAYEYDFGDGWQPVIRVERGLSVDAGRTCPLCVGGARTCPLEDCGGPWAYLAMRQHFNPAFVAGRLAAILSDVIDARTDVVGEVA